MELPSGRSLYSYCTNISMEDVHSLVLMRGVTGIVCFSLCFTSLVLEIIHTCSQKGSTVLQRFFVYVIVSNLLRAAFLSMDVFSHRDSLNVNEEFCKTIGFFSQYFASFQLLTIIGMMLLLFHNLFTLNLKYKNLCSRLFKNVPYMDVFIMIILFLLPSLYTWIPFVIQGGIYGDAGPWCWLKAFDSNCSSIDAAFILETVFWNAPFGIVLMFCCVCVTIYLIFFIYMRFCRIIAHKRVFSILVDSCFLFLFFALYTSLCMIEILALMFVHTHKTAGNYQWLVLYAVTLPIGEISLSLSSFVHFFRTFCKSWKPGRAGVKLYHNDISRLSNDGHVEPSFRISAKSYTDQQERPNFLSESTSIFSKTDSKYGTLKS